MGWMDGRVEQEWSVESVKDVVRQVDSLIPKFMAPDTRLAARTLRTWGALNLGRGCQQQNAGVIGQFVLGSFLAVEQVLGLRWL